MTSRSGQTPPSVVPSAEHHCWPDLVFARDQPHAIIKHRCDLLDELAP
jgi:hypothetical protein